MQRFAIITAPYFVGNVAVTFAAATAQVDPLALLALCGYLPAVRDKRPHFFAGKQRLQGVVLHGSEFVSVQAEKVARMLFLFDFCSPTDEIYRNTVAMIRSPEYKYSFANSPINEIGCPHAPHPWILSLANSLLCGRVEHCRAILEKISMDNGIACESVDEVTGYCTTGEAFATCAGFLCHSIREALL